MFLQYICATAWCKDLLFISLFKLFNIDLNNSLLFPLRMVTLSFRKSLKWKQNFHITNSKLNRYITTKMIDMVSAFYSIHRAYTKSCREGYKFSTSNKTKLHDWAVQLIPTVGMGHLLQSVAQVFLQYICATAWCKDLFISIFKLFNIDSNSS